MFLSISISILCFCSCIFFFLVYLCSSLKKKTTFWSVIVHCYYSWDFVSDSLCFSGLSLYHVRCLYFSFLVCLCFLFLIMFSTHLFSCVSFLPCFLFDGFRFLFFWIWFVIISIFCLSVSILLKFKFCSSISDLLSASIIFSLSLSLCLCFSRLVHMFFCDQRYSSLFSCIDLIWTFWQWVSVLLGVCLFVFDWKVWPRL